MTGVESSCLVEPSNSTFERPGTFFEGEPPAPPLGAVCGLSRTSLAGPGKFFYRPMTAVNSIKQKTLIRMQLRFCLKQASQLTQRPFWVLAAGKFVFWINSIVDSTRGSIQINSQGAFCYRCVSEWPMDWSQVPAFLCNPQ